MDLDMLTFFCRGDCGVCHPLLCCLVSSLKNQLSSLLMTLSENFFSQTFTPCMILPLLKPADDCRVKPFEVKTPTANFNQPKYALVDCRVGEKILSLKIHTQIVLNTIRLAFFSSYQVMFWNSA